MCNKKTVFILCILTLHNCHMENQDIKQLCPAAEDCSNVRFKKFSIVVPWHKK